MTSSLVGSEMCIRDRKSSLARTAWVPWQYPGGEELPWHSHSSCSHIGTCLLYTSDAADDM
eukprot:1622528-Prorocentrum_lima.AAC.1